LATAARLYPDRPALDFFGRQTNYAKLADEVSRAARLLADRGVVRGTVVALVMPNCPQHVVAFHAVLRLGGIVVEHNPLYTVPEFTDQLADSGATLVIAWDNALPHVLSACTNVTEQTGRELDVLSVDLTRALPLPLRLALHLPLPKIRSLRAELGRAAPKGIPSWDELVASSTPLDEAVPGPAVDDVALLQYTGGTTGTPKGAILTHANLLVNAIQAVAWVPKLVPGQEVFYGVLPFFHSFGMTLCLTAPIHLGALLVIFPKFSVAMTLSAQRRIPGTFFPGVPPMFDRLQHQAASQGIDLTSFRHAISGAMALPPAVAERWEQSSGGVLVEGYGLTEASPICVGNPISDKHRPGTLGLPWPSTYIRIVDPKAPQREVAPGESGELWVRGPQVFAGYWNRPEETAIVLQDGWLRTGDIVVQDPDGLIRLVDRIKEIIIVGGFNIYPSEVERCLAGMPQIDEVAVVGIPDSDLGDQVVAAIVLAEGCSLTLKQVRAWCSERIAHYATPRGLVFVPALPRSQIGKVLRREVRSSIISGATPLVSSWTKTTGSETRKSHGIQASRRRR
jgi:long-chain acyl-CoA synthetase